MMNWKVSTVSKILGLFARDGGAKSKDIRNAGSNPAPIIRHLHDIGWIQVVDDPGRGKRYELTERGEQGFEVVKELAGEL